jgi:transcriptional regulator with XRE-family HTH domain
MGPSACSPKPGFLLFGRQSIVHVMNKPKLATRFPAELRELRLRRGLTQRQLAKEMQYPVTTVTKWENGRAEPNYGELLLLCEILVCTPNTLIVGDASADLGRCHRLRYDPADSDWWDENYDAYRRLDLTGLQRLLLNVLLTRKRLWVEEVEADRRLNSPNAIPETIRQACRVARDIELQLYTVHTDVEVILGRMAEIAEKQRGTGSWCATGPANGTPEAVPRPAPAAARRHR